MKPLGNNWPDNFRRACEAAGVSAAVLRAIEKQGAPKDQIRRLRKILQ